MKLLTKPPTADAQKAHVTRNLLKLAVAAAGGELFLSNEFIAGFDETPPLILDVKAEQGVWIRFRKKGVSDAT